MSDAQVNGAKWGGLISHQYEHSFRFSRIPGDWAPRTGYKSVSHQVLRGKQFWISCVISKTKGPELPRQPLFGGEALQGDVLEWKASPSSCIVTLLEDHQSHQNYQKSTLFKGKFGWIKPLQPIDHPLAAVTSDSLGNEVLHGQRIALSLDTIPRSMCT